MRCLHLADLADLGSWGRRRAWYEANGFTLGANLFTSEESGAGLDSVALDKQVAQIRDLVT